MGISSFIKRKTFFKRFRLIGQPTYKWVEFMIPSTLHLSPFVKLILEPVLKNQSFNKMQLGLQEALVNAVRHGNLCDPNKYIRVRRILTPKWVVLQIQDEGTGVPIDGRTSSLPVNLDAESGRGFFLIHQCFDDVRWSKRGNRLQLSCRR
tara:strand:- start:175 stop:624 length:450 start_codon:yes stop_codon:yes gene_type:complete